MTKLVDDLERRGFLKPEPAAIPSGPDLAKRREHEPRRSQSKGRVILSCSCGKRIGRFPAQDKHAIEVAWFQHADGGDSDVS